MKKLCILLCLLFLTAALPAGASEGYLWPVDGYYNISSGFGRRSFSTHRGIDITGAVAGQIAGAPVLAARAGVVSAINTSCTHNYAKSRSCGCGGGYGNYVYVAQGDGTQARYGHLSTVSVAVGESVAQGQAIGLVGSTGSSSGFHLHFEVRNAADQPLNPMPVNADGRHTYDGSSAPFSESVIYTYTLPTPVTEPVAVMPAAPITATAADGIIRAEAPGAAPGSQLCVAQYRDGILLSFDAGQPGAATLLVSAAAGADSAKVLLWEGIYPVEKAIFLAL